MKKVPQKHKKNNYKNISQRSYCNFTGRGTPN